MKAFVLLLILPVLARSIERKSPASDLGSAKRVFVEQLGGGQNSDQMRDMIISAIQNAGLFVITEKQDTADAIIRGSSDDKTYTEDHNTSESVGLHSSTGSGSSSSNTTSGGTSVRKSLGIGLTDNETSHIEDRRHEASAALRMVNGDGDVIWSTTQESGGGKFRGAMADVADKITRQLVSDVHKARKEAARGEAAGVIAPGGTSPGAPVQ